jgi:tellurite resistance protein TerC
VLIASLFALVDCGWFYAGFVGAVLVLLALDLGVVNRKAEAPSVATAARWTLFWVALAFSFAGVFWLWIDRELAKPEMAAALAASGYGEPAVAASRLTFEFVAGYLLEASLSVDNLFVFLVLFQYFAVPATLQHRVLFYGILGALIFRAIFIGAGAFLLQFHWVVWIFGIFLFLTGVKLLLTKDDGGPDPERNPFIRFLRKFLPVTDGYRGSSFFVRESGRWLATPLFVTLLAVEMTDVIFAVDSIPAVYGVTREPIVVFTSNVFAILGLRSIYFLLAGAMDRFWMLKWGLGIVLSFVGVKMTILEGMVEDKSELAKWSLGVIVVILGCSLVLSLLIAKPGSKGRPAGG